MNAILTACDKDSSRGFVETVEFENKKEFLEAYKKFKENVPFSRWYVEVESDDEKLIDTWMED